VEKENRDADWEFIVFEYAMNFSLDALKDGYSKHKQEEAAKVDAETLRMLGYSEDAILNRVQ
jgi:hypothetical protein